MARSLQPVELPCVSCLERFTYTIRVPDFALHIDLVGPETIDLTPFIREDLLLNLPAYPHCDRDGGRICQAAAAEPARARDRRNADAELEKARISRDS